MNKSQSSITARGIAFARAFESSRPAGERICYDPLARQMISTPFYLFCKLFAGYAEAGAPACWGSSPPELAASTIICKAAWMAASISWSSWALAWIPGRIASSSSRSDRCSKWITRLLSRARSKRSRRYWGTYPGTWSTRRSTLTRKRCTSCLTWATTSSGKRFSSGKVSRTTLQQKPWMAPWRLCWPILPRAVPSSLTMYTVRH